jgi:hypothetical protein
VIGSIRYPVATRLLITADGEPLEPPPSAVIISWFIPALERSPATRAAARPSRSNDAAVIQNHHLHARPINRHREGARVFRSPGGVESIASYSIQDVENLLQLLVTRECVVGRLRECSGIT